eukprot:TRINITY_DN22659_c0_g1_i1.p1 TRINITY_DN22659_c0_g1~~TRINITY_DN22659_c0_g1_i1.p1  ORF type:complete len:804 (+),score=119.88 TRINITY_DN22659_c0_g1_i1:217-2412(+)
MEMEQMTQAYTVLRLLPYYAGLFIMIKTMKDYLQKSLVANKAFSTFMLGMTTVVFVCAMFEYFFQTIWPLCGYNLLLEATTFQVQAACLISIDMGSWRLLCLAYACAALLFTPLMLLPPIPGTSRKIVARFASWAKASFHPGEKKTSWDCVQKLWLRAYFVLFFVQIFTVYSVYRFATVNEMFIDLAPLANNSTQGGVLGSVLREEGGPKIQEALASQMALTSDPHLRALLITLIYLVLCWCQFMIVYDRLVERSFQDDFPSRMLMLAFPFLGTFEGIAGKAWATAQKTGKSAEELMSIAQSASSQIQIAPKVFKEMSDTIQARFQDLENIVSSQAEQVKGVAGQAIEDSVKILEHSLQLEADRTATELSDYLLRSSESRSFWNMCRSIYEDNFVYDLDDLSEPCCSKVLNCISCGMWGRSSSPPSESSCQHLLIPGTEEFRTTVDELLKKAVRMAVDAANKQIELAEDEAQEKASEIIDELKIGLNSKLEEASDFLKHNADLVLKEIEDLAMHANTVTSSIKNVVSRTKDILSGATDTAAQMNNYSEQLVKVVLLLPFLHSGKWVYIYSVMAFVILTVTLVALCSTIRVVHVMFAADLFIGESTMSSVVSGVITVSLVVYLFFIGRYVVFALTGQLHSIRGHWLMTKDEAGILAAWRQPLGDGDSEDSGSSGSESGASKCANFTNPSTAVGILIFFVVIGLLAATLYKMTEDNFERIEELQGICSSIVPK